jgi:hypothetical protein
MESREEIENSRKSFFEIIPFLSLVIVCKAILRADAIF